MKKKHLLIYIIPLIIAIGCSKDEDDPPPAPSSGAVTGKITDQASSNAVENAAIVMDILAGKPGPKRDVVLLNAAYALVAAGLSRDVEAGLVRSRGVIDDGLAKAKLEGLIALTNL